MCAPAAPYFTKAPSRQKGFFYGSAIDRSGACAKEVNHAGATGCAIEDRLSEGAYMGDYELQQVFNRVVAGGFGFPGEIRFTDGAT